MLVSEDSPFDFNVTYSNVFMTCAEAQEHIDRLLNQENDQGLVTVMPVFEDIALPPAEPFEFDVELIQGQGFTCGQLEEAIMAGE